MICVINVCNFSKKVNALMECRRDATTLSSPLCGYPLLHSRSLHSYFFFPPQSISLFFFTTNASSSLSCAG
jgi:hypothetical protein